MIFNMSGGAKELAIKIVGGTVQPTGVSGLIWVNTATAILNWTFATAQPTNPMAGDIWVQTDAVSANVVNLIKSNAINVNVLRIKQYIGATWVPLFAYYFSSSWVLVSNPWTPSTDITYTGSMVFVDDGSGAWTIKLLTSGMLRFLNEPTTSVDVFLVGGGGGGGLQGTGGGGGGGGRTLTSLNRSVQGSVEYQIVVGAGGAIASSGGTTTALGFSIAGGDGAPANNGGAGGSGGGGSQASGGTNGGSGSTNGTNYGGAGQGTTTKEFGSASGTLYSGGGGGYMGYSGGAGGGGQGSSSGNGGSNGTTNLGGGGGQNHAGGSGIVVIRSHR